MSLKTEFIKKIFLSFVAVSSCVVFPGCYDEVRYNQGNPVGREGVLTVYIPDMESASEYARSRSDQNTPTRAEVDASEKEAKINTLWFCAYPLGNTSASPVIENITGKKVTGSGDGYTEYAEYLVEGMIPDQKYHIYLLANLEDYLPANTVNDKMEESTLQSLILNFADESDALKLNSSDSYLPMACYYDEIKSSPSQLVSGGEFTFSDDNATLYADLTFLCTKVRYTILFNAAQGGISSEFGENYVEFPTDNSEAHYATNLRKYTHINKDATLQSLNNGFIGSDYKFALPLRKYAYPTKDGVANDEYPIFDNTNNTVEGNLSTEFTGTDNSKAAWQGVIYIPENITETANEKTTLTFNGIVKYANGDEDNTRLAGKKIPVNNKEDKGNKRGTFMDYRALIKDFDEPELEFECEVMDWSTQNLVYTLHGPYDLIVDETKVGVYSGQTTYMHYSTESGGKVYAETPQYTLTDGSTIDVFIIEIDGDNENGVLTPGLISIRLNNRIPHSLSETELKEISYFHICVGQLKKRIDVEPLEIGPYLNVNPTSYTINVKEFRSSGSTGSEDNGIPITFNTNISDLQLTIQEVNPETGEPVPGEPFLQDYKIVEETSEQVINLGGEGLLKITHNIKNPLDDKLYISFSGIGGESSFWNSKHSYRLTFTIYENGEVIKESDYEGLINPQTVDIEVAPDVNDYIIHFRAIDDSWTNPHIYIYQCLELPTDLKDAQGNILPQAGKTVGYSIGNAYNSGREYAFTSGIAFKGWSGYGGPSINDPYSGGSFDPIYQTFWVFNFDNGISYNAAEESSEPRYFWKLDFNASQIEHLSEAGANPCNGTDGKKCPDSFEEWPGIAMYKETIAGETWYTYILTGIATPGKALIMFADGHDGKAGENRRYPENNNIGVPLFDYPDHEGWFLYDPSQDSFKDLDKTRDDLKFSDSRPIVEEKQFFWLCGSMTGGSAFENGSDYGWGYKNDVYRFYKVGENQWKTNVLDLPNGGEFKINPGTWDSQYNDYILGAQNTDTNQSYYTLKSSDYADFKLLKESDGSTHNIRMNEDFVGTVTLTLESNGYHMKLEKAEGYANIWLVGDCTGWGNNLAYRFIEDATDSWHTKKLVIDTANHFKIRNQANWDGWNIGFLNQEETVTKDKWDKTWIDIKNNSGAKDIIMGKKFTGVVRLKKINNTDFQIFFDTKEE
ncbi:MAG: hypothetical protein J1F16_03520 [Muribaculaceae bacterium]|nr:hypothetical protein [Muribaculaceae bacterium]